ncbi:MAG: TonB-dependent receptor [Saprospiraceae bacterium]
MQSSIINFGFSYAETLDKNIRFKNIGNLRRLFCIAIHARFSIICIICFFTFFGFAHSSGIRGIVRDNNTLETLPSASIRYGTTGIVSDDQGKYSIALSPGRYDVEISYIGFETLKKNVTVTTGQWLELDFNLHPSENVLQTAVISDSRYSKPITESTISIEVLRASLIDHINSTSIEGALDRVPGVNMVGGQANIRGGAGYSYGAGSRVLLMINDLPALQADAGYPNWDDVPIENIEQVEIIKGAASASYGSSALNGLIHVRTKYAKSEPVTRVSIFYNPVLAPKDKSQQWWTSAPYTEGISFSHAQKYGKLDLVLGAYGQKFQGFNQTTRGENIRGNGSIQYRITDRLSIGTHFNLNKRNSNSYFYWKDGVHAIYRPDSLTLSNSNSFRYHVDPFITYFDQSNNKHSLRSRIYVVDNGVSGGQSNSSTLVYTEYQFQRHWEKAKVYGTGGLVYNYNTSNSDLFKRVPFTTVNKALFIQLDKKISDHTTLTGGWRFEDYRLHRPEVFIDDTLPGGVRTENKSLFRFGINSGLTKGLFARASWGQGFRFPTLAEQFIVTNFGSTFISPNPKLHSETGWSSEVGLKQALIIGNTKAFIDAALFWSKYQDMMEFTFTGFVKGFQSQNIGDTDIKGYELTMGGITSFNTHKLTYSTGYTYINPLFANFTEEDNRRSSADFNILKYRSKHLFKFDLEDEFNGWTLGTGVLYTSKMEAVDAIFEFVIKGLKEYRVTHGGYTIMDLRIARKIKAFNFNFIIKNLLNEEYTARPAISESPRNLTFRVDYNF